MKKISDLEKRQTVLFDDNEEDLPNISELANGIYKALFYAWIFELEDGRKYKTNFGIRRSRRQTKWTMYSVINGDFNEVSSIVDKIE